ncbi:MAG: efflux RND transporter periplasmic adaptor subunit [Janthinobacterium lividum]
MKAWTGVIVGALVLAGGYAGWRTLGHKDEKPAPPPAVPVTAAKAAMTEVPVYLRGIGTVRALNAVEIHPQVGGVLLQVPVREGDEVEKGAVLAVIDPRPYQAALDKAKAQRVQDQAQLDNAQTDAKRYTTLARSDFASRQQVDTQISTVNRFQGVVAADDAAIEEAEINLGYCVVHAPLAGRVGLRRVDPGNLIQANATGPGILSVVQDHPISVVFTLPEKMLPTVKAAMLRGPVAVLADTSDATAELARGKLLTPDNAVDPASGTIGMKAIFDNLEGALTPGQFVSVRVQSSTTSGVGVPHEAVQHGQDGLFVLLVKPDKTADRRPVEVAYDDGKTAVVSKGIAAEDQVIVSGQSRVGSGTRVALHDDGAEPADSQKSAQK